MSDQNALAVVDHTQLPSTQVGTDDDFDNLSQGLDFLGRLQLFTKGKDIDAGRIPPGHWGIPEGDDQITDLGISVDCMPLARRPKALDLNDKENIIQVYDMKSPEFQRIQEAAGGQNSNCMFGPSFLLIERSTGRFLEYFCGTKSTRPEAKKIYPFLPLTEADIEARGLEVDPHGPLPFTMGVKHITKKFSYHVPVVTKCSTPFAKLPSVERMVAEIQKFVNPDAGAETASEEEVATSGRAR